MRSLGGAPEVALDIGAEDGAVVGYEIRCVVEGVGRLGIGMARADERAGDDADAELLGKGPVPLQVGLPVCAGGGEVRVGRDPIRKVILWKYDEIAALGCGGADVGGRFFEVFGGLKGLSLL